MSGKVGIFWPGDYRPRPNELALPEMTAATVQLECALVKLGRSSYRVEGYLTKPHEAIEKLGPIDDPLIGVYVHWVYGPHTTDGVVGKDTPLLLASNFSGYFPVPGGTFTGLSQAGKITWSRAYIRGGELWMDVGRGEVVDLPAAKREAWWNGTTREWPLMTADLGITRDTLMAHYFSNHIAVAYGDIFEEMLVLSQRLGFKVRVLQGR